MSPQRIVLCIETCLPEHMSRFPNVCIQEQATVSKGWMAGGSEWLMLLRSILAQRARVELTAGWAR